MSSTLPSIKTAALYAPSECIAQDNFPSPQAIQQSPTLPLSQSPRLRLSAPPPSLLQHHQVVTPLILHLRRPSCPAHHHLLPYPTVSAVESARAQKLPPEDKPAPSSSYSRRFPRPMPSCLCPRPSGTAAPQPSILTSHPSRISRGNSGVHGIRPSRQTHSRANVNVPSFWLGQRCSTCEHHLAWHVCRPRSEDELAFIRTG